MTSGQFVSFFYVTLYIMVPMVSNLLFGQAYWSIYFYTDPPFWALALIVGLWLIIASPIMRIRLARKRRPNKQLRLLEAFIRQHTLKLAILIALLIGLLYSPTSAAFRYTSGGISSGGIQLILVLILKSVASIALMWLLVVYVRQDLHLRRSDRLAVWILAGIILYTVNGTASFLTATFFLLFAASPKLFVHLVFIETDSPLLSAKSLLHLLSPVLILALFFMALMVGDSVKQSGQIRLDNHSVTFSITWLAVRVVDGISSHYYALAQFFDQRVYQILEQFSYPLSYPLSSIEYRIGQLLGLNVQRPEIQSISRLNFIANSFKISESEGTSPGFFASFLYIMPLPFGILAAMIYIRWIISVIDRFFDLPGFKLSLFGSFFVLLQFLFAYQSPPDFLILLDNTVISIFLVWLFARFGENARLQQSFDGSPVPGSNYPLAHATHS